MIKWSGDKTETATLNTEWRLLHALRSPRFARPVDFRSVGEAGAWMTTARSNARPISEYAGAGPHELLQITAEALMGLAALHRAGHIHGDVRPQNLLVGRRGEGFDVLWVDLEHAVKTDQLSAGFGYVAGWNASALDLGEPQSGRTDLAALGKLLGELAARGSGTASGRGAEADCLAQFIAELTSASSDTALYDAGEAAYRLSRLCRERNLEWTAPTPDPGPAMYVANRRAERMWRAAWPRWCAAERPVLVHLYGAAGCGKSSFLHGAAARAALDGHIVFDLSGSSALGTGQSGATPDWARVVDEIESSSGIVLMVLPAALWESYTACVPGDARPGLIVVVESRDTTARTPAVPASWQSEEFPFPPFTEREWLRWANASY